MRYVVTCQMARRVYWTGERWVMNIKRARQYGLIRARKVARNEAAQIKKVP